MEIGDIIKAIMKERKVTQNTMGAFLDRAPNGLSRDLSYSPNAVTDRVKMLEYLGYEVIVREKRPGRRAEGEYVVTVGKEKPAEEDGGADDEKAVENERKPIETKGKVKMKPVDVSEGIRLLREQIAMASGEGEGK